MPITILDYAASVIPGQQFYTAQGQPANRIEIFGPPRTCQSCRSPSSITPHLSFLASSSTPRRASQLTASRSSVRP